jgi:hypothetical protein
MIEDDEHSHLKRPPSLSDDHEGLEDDDLLLATPIVYGFSLTVKRWCEYTDYSLWIHVLKNFTQLNAMLDV